MNNANEPIQRPHQAKPKDLLDRISKVKDLNDWHPKQEARGEKDHIFL
jgi:hypothetical protein